MDNLLDSIRVLDLSRLLPGPFCTLWMARLGAEVIKIETPGQGEYLRTLPPLAGKINWLFAALNRGKSSLALDLKKPEGVEAFLRLVKEADVVVESFRPGVMDELGIGWNRLRQRNPRLVFASITGFGATGPYRDRPGHDINYMAVSGLLALSGPRGGKPSIPSAQVSDLGGGSLTALSGILAAIIARERTGMGRKLDVSMLDGVVGWLPAIAMEFFARDMKISRGEAPLNGSEPCYQVYPTKDGKFMALGAIEPKFWLELCKTLCRLDLVSFQYTGPDMMPETYDKIAEVFKTRTRDEWAEIFLGVDACVEPVLEIDEVENHPQVRERELFCSFHDPHQDRDIKTVSVPLRYDPPLPPFDASYPLLGLDSRAILLEAGYSNPEIDELIKKGVTQESGKQAK